MKRIYILALLLAIGSMVCRAQHAFLDKYADMDECSSVYISKSMLSMFPDMSGSINGVNVGNLASRLEHIQIISAEKPELIELLKKDTKHLHSDKGYEVLMRVRDDGDKVNIYFKESKNGKNEFLLIAEEEDEFTIVSIVGNVTLKEFQGMMESD